MFSVYEFIFDSTKKNRPQKRIEDGLTQIADARMKHFNENVYGTVFLEKKKPIYVSSSVTGLCEPDFDEPYRTTISG